MIKKDVGSPKSTSLLSTLQEEEVEKQEEVEGEGEKQLKDNRTSWMIWRWNEREVRAALSHVV